MTNSHQQAIVDVGSDTHPPMLEKGSYVLWSSRFLRYLEGKKEHGKRMRDSIFNGPYEWKTIQEPSTPNTPASSRTQEEKYLIDEEKI
ncbi:hypothetical protein Tco_0064119 [Tanacetum coccineum]